MSRTTPLHEAHVAASGKLVDFAGWSLPIHYGSQIDEHRAVRRGAGVFDVSHMTIVDIEGDGARAWLRTMLANDVAKLDDGEALYGCLCNERGGVLDDLIVYRLAPTRWRLVTNAATREKVLGWLEAHRSGDVALAPLEGRALIAVQGPEAIARAAEALRETGAPADAADLAELPRFGAAEAGELFVARTGYTGEDGVEILLPGAAAPALWQALLAIGVRPCGLGARDTLRLEAGMSLYGTDLDEAYTPFESGLGWTVHLGDEARDFVGRETLVEQQEFGGRHVRVGLVLDARGVLRGGQVVQRVGRDVGRITSGTFSPTREQSIGLARVDRAFKGGCDVLIRDRPMPARVVPVPFVRGGRATG